MNNQEKNNSGFRIYIRYNQVVRIKQRTFTINEIKSNLIVENINLNPLECLKGRYLWLQAVD